MASEPRLAHSQLEDHRRFFTPRLPSTLAGAFKTVVGEARGAMGDKEKIQALFPKTYGKPTLSFEAADEAVARRRAARGWRRRRGRAAALVAAALPPP